MDLSDDEIEAPSAADLAAIERQKLLIIDRLQVTANDVLRIARIPQRSAEWHRARHARLSGSIIGSVVGLCEYATPDVRLRELLWSTFNPNNKFCEYGIRMEPYIRNEVELYFQISGAPDTEYTFDYPGCVVCQQRPFLSYSPDGIVTCRNKRTGLVQRFLLEFKARYSGKDYKQGRIPWGYYCQIMLGMHILNLSHAVFAVLLGPPNKKQLKIELYERDNVFIESLLLPRAERFFTERLLPALAKKELGLLYPGMVA